VLKYMPKSIEIQQAQELGYRGDEGLQHLTLSTGGVVDVDEGEYVGEGTQGDGGDTEAALVSETDRLLHQLYPDWNKAKREIEIGKFKGNMPHLLAQIKERIAACQQEQSSASEAAGSEQSASSAGNRQQNSATSPSASGTSGTSTPATRRSATAARGTSAQIPTTAQATPKPEEEARPLEVTEQETRSFKPEPLKQSGRFSF
jgi:hypothetical protein